MEVASAYESPKFEVTEFDKLSIKFMGVDEKIDGECGLWAVHRYAKEYIILTFDSKPKMIDALSSYEQVLQKLENL
jgi:hypothetical protein